MPYYFTLAEANELLPIIRHISNKHNNAIERALADQRYLLKTGAPQFLVSECDAVVVKQLQIWGGKLLKLGVKQFQGGWMGFDMGQGYYSWCVNEQVVSYYHGYLENPSARRPIGVILR